MNLKLNILLLTLILAHPAHAASKKSKKKADAAVQLTTQNKKAEQKTAEAQPIKKNKVWGRSLATMTFDELKEAKNDHLKRKDPNGAIKFLEKMLPQCNDLNELHDLMLELAELYQSTDHLEKASGAFLEFTKMYPGSEKVEYAYFKTIECSFKGINDAERDQTITKDTIELADSFLERASAFNEYKDKVLDIRLQCQQRLFDSELNIYQFYVHRGYKKSAQKRLENMRKQFIEELPATEPIILTCEIDWATMQKQLDIAQEKKLALAQKFPDFIPHTQQATSKKNMTNRF